MHLTSIICMCLSLCMAVCAWADEQAAKQPLEFEQITTRKGETFKHVRVIRFDPLEMRFSHDGGVGTLLLADAPPEIQHILGYDPVAADFHMTAMQAERQRQIIAEEDQKSSRAKLAKKQKAESDAIKAIEARGCKLLIFCWDVGKSGAFCNVQGIRLVPHKGRSAEGRKTATRLKMSGDPELVEEAYGLDGGGAGSWTNALILGLAKEQKGKQWSQVVYPCQWDAHGRVTVYAATANEAYRCIYLSGK